MTPRYWPVAYQLGDDEVTRMVNAQWFALRLEQHWPDEAGLIRERLGHYARTGALFLRFDVSEGLDEVLLWVEAMARHDLPHARHLLRQLAEAGELSVAEAERRGRRITLLSSYIPDPTRIVAGRVSEREL